MIPRVFLLLALLLSFHGFAQQFVVNGKVLDSNRSSVAFANVLLLRSSDSTLIKGTSTEDDGTFILNGVAPGQYILNITYLGFSKLSKSINVEGNLDTGEHVLSELSEDLDEINIIAKRPTLVRQPDRLQFNVANTALIEGSILQVIKSTPSLVVIDGSIKIKNTSPEVYINNRKIRLSATELLEFLETAPANSIKSIEVITNPPASYDASSGSVVNIIMDKNLVAGYRGSLGTKYTQGVFPRYNVSTNHFFRGRKSGFNLSYSYNNSKINRQNNDIVNYLDNDNNLEQIWASDIGRVTNSETHNLSLNYDYNFDDRNTLVLSSSALYIPYFKYRILNETDIRNSAGNFLSSFLSNNLSRDDKYNVSADLDYTHKFIEKGKLSFNAHYTAYDYNRFQVVNSDFFDNDREFLSASQFNTDNNQGTDIYSSRLDYSVAIDDSSNLEAGLKFGFIDTESDITRRDVDSEGQEVINNNGTNIFTYDEKIAAAYINYSKEWEKWSINLGLRAENTDIEGVSGLDAQLNAQDYVKWFPNASLQYNVSENLNLRSTYKKSITRPNFDLLNPFQFFLNENTVVSGNPELQPKIEDHVVFGADIFEDFTFETYLIKSDGKIYELPLQDNALNVITYTPVNIDRSLEYGFDFVYQKSILDNWFIYAVTSFYHQEDKNTFGDQTVDIDQWSNLSAVSNSISFLKDNSLNVDFSLTYISKYIDVFANVDPRLLSELSISKTILKGQGVLSLNAGDLFNTSDAYVVTDYLNQSSVYDTDEDNRFVTFGFRYKFGNTKLTTNERTISTEEKERLNKK